MGAAGEANSNLLNPLDSESAVQSVRQPWLSEGRPELVLKVRKWFDRFSRAGYGAQP